MTSPDTPPEAQASDPVYAARAYRSTMAIITGVVMLAIGVWLVGDAVLHGEGMVPWLALAGLLLGAPLAIAFTLRPAVFASDDRLVVRNPFRTVTLPWAAVEDLRSGYSTEVFADGRRYQLWAIPVSLRQRKRAARRQARAAAEDPFGRTSTSAHTPGAAEVPYRAWADMAVDELRELAERNRDRPGATGETTVRWAFEVLAPSLAGAVVLLVLLATG
ncbi:PH domain-containing protein [Streptomyces capparidis]